MTAPILFVIPTFNRARDLPRTIGAIAAQDWPKDAIAVLVVDNASTDDTAAVVADLATDLPVALRCQRKAPEGPAAARSLGLGQAAADGFVAFVDSDVELDPGWTRATMAAMAQDPGLAMVGGRVVFAHDRAMLNAYGAAISPLGLCWDLDEGAPAGNATGPRDVIWMNASAVLARAAPLRDAGGFDRAFFYGYEEPDLGLRLALAGHRARVVPGAVAIHHVGTEIGPSHPTMVFHYAKNRLRMGLKCFGPARLAWWLPAILAYSLADAVLHRPRGARLRALLWNVMNLPGTLALRRHAQAQRRLPDREAFALMTRRWFPAQRLAGLRRRPVGAIVAGQAADDRTAP
jgi:GT2 family glycosyltransferase